METKWYSDFWRLLASPFKGGIDQVVQSGTLQKRFLGHCILMGYSIYYIGFIWDYVNSISPS